MRKCFMPENKFREGIVFMKFKFPSAFIFLVILLGIVGHHFLDDHKVLKEARRGHTASIQIALDHHSDFSVERRGQTA